METSIYWNNLITTEWFLGVGILIDILEHVLPAEDDSIVGILGSLPLLLYQEQHKVGPKWKTPSDMDVFLSGKLAENDDTFDAYIKGTVLRIKQLYGPLVTLAAEFETYTRMQGQKFHLKNYRIGGIDMKLSFIQCRGCSDLVDVAKGFDISICRVIYQFHSRKLTCSREVHNDICQGRATVDGIVLSEGLVAKRDWVAVTRTMKRMRKYQERGFTMVNGGGVAFH